MLMTGGYKGEAALSLHDTASTAGSRALARIQGRNNSIIARARDRSPLAAGHQKTLIKRQSQRELELAASALKLPGLPRKHIGLTAT